MNCTLDETSSCGLLIRKRVLLGNTHIDQECDRKRPIGFSLKCEQLLLHSVFKHTDVINIQGGYETMLLVENCEWQVGDVSVDSNYIDVIVGVLGSKWDTAAQPQHEKKQ